MLKWNSGAAAAWQRITMRIATVDSNIPQVMNRRLDGLWALVNETGELIRNSENPPPEAIATIMWCLPLVADWVPEVRDLLPVIYGVLPEVVESMNARNLTRSLNSVVRLYRRMPEARDMVPDLLEGIELKAEEMEPEDIANNIFSAGELGLGKDQAYSVTGTLLQNLSPEGLRSLRLRELTNLVWGLSQLDERDDGLLKEAANRYIELAPETDKKGGILYLPTAVCAFAKIGYLDERFLDAVAFRMRQSQAVQHLTNWGLAAMIWAWPARGDKYHLRMFLMNKLKQKPDITNAMIERSWMGPMQWVHEEREDEDRQAKRAYWDAVNSGKLPDPRPQERPQFEQRPSSPRAAYDEV
ncbi:unnamed protein product [Polarella glacialis]|uniref:Uncharacterized protein n=1 Tax=Polarella glacialis TaxID=89957 RepID=A0A813E980_POLGL|nr:unnamed protein product [Polarella glacialis]CAE8704713.1 unnamed protein product [Polarella glacialis]